MATKQATVDDLLDRLAGAGRVTARKMFGEYCIYLDGKPVALVCDGRLYIKPTAAGRELMPDAAEGPPYPGAKPHLVLPPERWADTLDPRLPGRGPRRRGRRLRQPSLRSR